MNTPEGELICLYAKQLRLPSFTHYENIIRQLEPSTGYEACIKQLATCEFVKKIFNIVMVGNPGVGKTHLSIALGLCL